MRKHTPGPWHYIRSSRTKQLCIVSTPAQYDVAYVPDLPEPPNEHDANASLIAAAPDLLEALKRLAAIVPEPELISMGFDSAPEHRTMEEHELGYALHLARDAIAEAEGA